MELPPELRLERGHGSQAQLIFPPAAAEPPAPEPPASLVEPEPAAEPPTDEPAEAAASGGEGEGEGEALDGRPSVASQHSSAPVDRGPGPPSATVSEHGPAPPSGDAAPAAPPAPPSPASPAAAAAASPSRKALLPPLERKPTPPSLSLDGTAPPPAALSPARSGPLPPLRAGPSAQLGARVAAASEGGVFAAATAAAAAAAASADGAAAAGPSTLSAAEEDALHAEAAAARTSFSVPPQRAATATSRRASRGELGELGAWDAASRRGSYDGSSGDDGPEGPSVMVVPQPQLIAVGPPKPPPPKPKPGKPERPLLEIAGEWYWSMWEFVGPRVGAALYLFSIGSDAFFIGSYGSPNFSLAPPLTLGLILLVRGFAKPATVVPEEPTAVLGLQRLAQPCQHGLPMHVQPSLCMRVPRASPDRSSSSRRPGSCGCTWRGACRCGPRC